VWNGLRTSTTADPAAGTSPWRTLAAVSIGSFMTILDATVVNVAIRSLQQAYGVQTATVQWVVSGYALALGIGTPLAGRLGDRWGTKRVYLLSLAAFTVASLLCGLAPTFGTLVAARVIQGLAGGFALPLGSARLFRAFPPQRRGLAFGVFSIVLVVAPTIGPLVGGAFVDAGLRSWIFFINVPIGVLGVLLGSRFLAPDRADRPAGGRIGLPSVALTAIGVGGILLATSLSGQARGPIALVALVVGVTALVALVAIERRRAVPLLNVRLYRIPTYALGTAINSIGQVALYGLQFLLPLALETVGHVSALHTGLAMVPLAVASGAGGMIAGKVRDSIGPRVPLTVALLLAAAGILVLIGQLSDPAPASLVPGMVLTGLGTGAVPPTIQVAALSDVPSSAVNGGTSLLQAVQRMSQSVGVAVLAAVVGATAATTDPAVLARYTAGLHTAFVVVLCVAIGCAVVAVFLPGWPGRRLGIEPHPRS
jgi:EmrB/QacA subfamily drug resistance transporter